MLHQCQSYVTLVFYFSSSLLTYLSSFKFINSCRKSPIPATFPVIDMGTVERSKKKVQLYNKAIFHFFLCFVMGFFTGFAPTGKSLFSRPVVASNRSAFSPQSLSLSLSPSQARTQSDSFNTSLLDETPIVAISTKSKSKSESEFESEFESEHERLTNLGEVELIPNRLIIVVTPTSVKDRLRAVYLRRLANTLRLVPPPLLWMVVEQKSKSARVSEILRKTGIMYRHLVFKENFTDFEAEMDHQRNLALNHIEHHRLSGIVHFAGLSNVYDLSFFDEIRAIEVFGTWPMAMLSANKKMVMIEGPVCDSSEVVGWHLSNMNNLTDTSSPVHISSFAFNSSILWDPERWGRSSSVQDTSQRC
ncbi:unnamed protein product [Camellia sinensis]